MLKRHDEIQPAYYRRRDVTSWCCVNPRPTPIAMCDGALIFANYLELSGGKEPLVVDLIGEPVWTTWGGCLARDK